MKKICDASGKPHILDLRGNLMTNNGYNTNGRPVISISGSGRGHSWRDIRLTLHTPEGSISGLSVPDTTSRLHLYEKRPVLEYRGELPAPLKNHLRRSISDMPY